MADIVKLGGWRVKCVTCPSYVPDPEWYPFAVTYDGQSDLIWLRQQIIEEATNEGNKSPNPTT